MGELETVRVGFLGCGRIADLQCLGYLEHRQARIHAVCDVDGALAKRRAEEWGAERVYTDYEQLVSDPDLDLIEILTPHHLHEEHAIAALEAGKHVSLQKPPARSLEEFDRITAVAEREGSTLRVFENFMHYPPHRKARELIEAGGIGMPLSVRVKTAAGHPDAGWSVALTSQAWRLNRETCGGGSTTFDHGYHCFNMGRYFMPAEVETVHAFIHWTKLGDDSAIDAPALISWRYAGEPVRYGSWEVIASLAMRVRSDYYVSDDRIEVHGSEGILWVNRCTGKLLEEPSVVLYREGETRAFHDLPTDWATSFDAGGRDMIDALLEGRQPSQSAAGARETLAFALAAQRSAAEGREVTIAEIAGAERSR